MRLIKTPRRPQATQYFLWVQRLQGEAYDSWLKFIPHADAGLVS
jgi:hypothetical protein